MRRNFVDIKVEIVKENEDGSADALVHFDKEGLQQSRLEGDLSH